MSAGVRVPPVAVALSTASAYPESTATAFELAARLGYDAVELMVWTDPVSQSVDAVRALSDLHGVPIASVHSPCLLVTQRVWSPDPWVRLQRAVEVAAELGAPTVVVHPPFRWQRDYARGFVDFVQRLYEEHGVAVAVENMYPWRARGREIEAYAPGWDVVLEGYEHCTLDLSHTAVSGSDALSMATELGPRLAHVHLADGSGSAKDEHLVPGRGNQPCGALCERLAVTGWAGTVVLEVTTRRARDRAERESDLAESLAFTRLHLASAVDTSYAVSPDGSVEPVLRGRSG